jgi:Putative transposase
MDMDVEASVARLRQQVRNRPGSRPVSECSATRALWRCCRCGYRWPGACSGECDGSSIADIAYQYKAIIYDILFKASAEATITIAADPKHLGACLGGTSVLHTWRSAMTHHPHARMIIPGGGLSEDGTRWFTCRPNFFLAVRVLSRLFRRLVQHVLLAAHQAGQLQFFDVHAALADTNTFAAFVVRLRRSEWVVYSKKPFAGPQAILAYPARYGGFRETHIRPSSAFSERRDGLDVRQVRVLTDAGRRGAP